MIDHTHQPHDHYDASQQLRPNTANFTIIAVLIVILFLAFINPVRTAFSPVSLSHSTKFTEGQLDSLVDMEKQVRPFANCYISSISYDEDRSNEAIALEARTKSADGSQSTIGQLIANKSTDEEHLAILTVAMPCNTLSPTGNFDHTSWYMLNSSGTRWTLIDKGNG